VPDGVVRLVVRSAALTTNRVMRQLPTPRIAVLVAATLLLTGCHGGSPAHANTSATTAPAPPTASMPVVAASSATTSSATVSSANPSAPLGSTAAVASERAAPTVGPASSAFITNVCSSITIADAQATVQPTIDAIGFDPDNQDPAGIFMCTIDAADQAVTVTVEPEDVAMANYESDVAAENVPAVPSLPGVGDVAVWTQVPNNPPDVYAHKGHVTCEVKTGDTQVLNLTYDPTVIDGGVTAASAAAYAVKLGALCADVFAAIG
jgi:hypothetical protein